MKLHKLFTGLMATILALTAVLAIPASSVFAADTTQDRDYPRVEFYLERERQLNDNIDTRIGFARDTATQLQSFIDQMNELGYDTGVLVQALADFNAGIETAQGHNNSARSILDAHAGFDDAGKVTNLSEALTTLRDGGYALIDANYALNDATRDLTATVRDYLREFGVGEGAASILEP